MSNKFDKEESLEPYLLELLTEANSLLRSASSIADREGKSTNWEAYSKQIKAALAKQHAVIFQRVDHVADEKCWCNPEIDYVNPDTGATVYVHKSLN